MPVDENATHYVSGNSRYDLMTDEEVRTLSCDDLMLIYMVLGEINQRCPGGSTEELGHQLYELHLRYPDRDFRFEVLPKE